MSKLGTKYACYQCGTKFYDLGKPQPLCPKCSANQRNAPPEDLKARARAAALADAEEDAEVAKVGAEEEETPARDDDDPAAEEEEAEEEEVF